jgi:hypothetical protein
VTGSTRAWGASRRTHRTRGSDASSANDHIFSNASTVRARRGVATATEARAVQGRDGRLQKGAAPDAQPERRLTLRRSCPRPRRARSSSSTSSVAGRAPGTAWPSPTPSSTTSPRVRPASPAPLSYADRRRRRLHRLLRDALFFARQGRRLPPAVRAVALIAGHTDRPAQDPTGAHGDAGRGRRRPRGRVPIPATRRRDDQVVRPLGGAHGRPRRVRAGARRPTHGRR